LCYKFKKLFRNREPLFSFNHELNGAEMSKRRVMQEILYLYRNSENSFNENAKKLATRNYYTIFFVIFSNNFLRRSAKNASRTKLILSRFLVKFHNPKITLIFFNYRLAREKMIDERYVLNRNLNRISSFGSTLLLFL
jgi:hypothetical protein